MSLLSILMKKKPGLTRSVMKRTKGFDQRAIKCFFIDSWPTNTFIHQSSYLEFHGCICFGVANHPLSKVTSKGLVMTSVMAI